MPESKVRKDAATKQKVASKQELAAQRAERTRLKSPKDRSWVPWVFVPVGLLGVLWLLVFYIAGNRVPGMQDLRNWNYLIGIGLIATSFGIATLWK